jgi:hypothetical protein
MSAGERLTGLERHASTHPMSATGRRMLQFAIGASLLAAARFASAERERVVLRFHADSGCPSEEAFRDEVLSRTREIRFESALPRRELEVSAGIVVSGAWGELRFHRPGEEGTSRSIEGKTCAEVLSGLALITVLAIDPNAAAALAPEPARATPAPPPSFDAPTPAQPARADRSPAPMAPALSLGFDGIVTGEAFTPQSPTLTVDIAVAVQLTLQPDIRPSIRPAVRLGGRLGTSLKVERGPGQAQFRTSTLSLEASPARLRLGPIEASGWAGFEWGQLIADGVSTRALAKQGQVSVPWLALLETARFAVELGAGFHAELEIGLVEPLRRDRFFFDQPSTLVHAVPAVGALAGLGVGYRFF